VTEAGKHCSSCGAGYSEKTAPAGPAGHYPWCIVGQRAEAVAAEKARIAAGGEPLLDAAMMTDDGSLDEVVDALAAVLRIIEGADR